MRRVVIVGAGGRDFHDFNVCFRDDPTTTVVAFTAAQIPGIDARRYPPALCGPNYPDGIPIVAEAELWNLVKSEAVDEVVLAYSDLAHDEVMHKASIALAAGADFRLLGPNATMLPSSRPVIAVCAARTGAGKSPTSRHCAALIREAGLRVALVRHPMPYGDLTAQRVQRFRTQADIDAARPTIEEREEYEAPVRMGITTYAGVDYAAILALAEADADVIVWDGGNNDFAFFRPDVAITVVDALRPDHGARFHPGETNVRLADVIVVNKVDRATPEQVEATLAGVCDLNPRAVVVQAASPVTLGAGPSLAGRRVLVIEDGPSVTHGGLADGAGTVAARAAGAVPVDPRPYAVGSIAATYAAFPHLGAVLPAMGYSDAQVADLQATIDATPCDAVVTGTPIDLAHLVRTAVPIRRAEYRYADHGSPALAEILAPFLASWRAAASA